MIRGIPKRIMDVNKFCGPSVSLAVKIQVGVLVKSYKQTTPDQQGSTHVEITGGGPFLSRRR